uniref:Uncharacterized protein n=1 Tax=mine drainage metagenome TaxID=410659 RepID=E6PXS5_9ZZZZ
MRKIEHDCQYRRTKGEYSMLISHARRRAGTSVTRHMNPTLRYFSILQLGVRRSGSSCTIRFAQHGGSSTEAFRQSL